MIDFAICAVLVAASVFLVRRVREYGFAGLRPPETLFASVGRVVLPEAERAAEERVEQPRPLYGLPTLSSPPAPAPRPDAAEAEPGAPPMWAPTPRPEPPPEPVLKPASPFYVIAWIAGAALVGLAVLLQAQLWQNRENLTPLWTLLLVGVAFAAIVRIGLRLPALADASVELWQPPRSLVALSRRLRLPRDLLRADRWILSAVVSEAIALICFERGAAGTIGWVLHFVAAALFFGGVWIASRADLGRFMGSWSRWDTVAIVAVTVAGAIPRVWQLGYVPEGIWFDEAQRGIETFRVLADPSFRPVWMTGIEQEPAFIRYLMAPFLAVMGRDPVALRIPTAVAGILGVTFIYLLARVLYGRRPAILAALIMAGLTWQLNYSRVAFPTMYSMTLDALAAAFLALGLKRRSAPAFAAMGLTLGAGAHFYYSSQLVPFIFALVVIHQLVLHRLQFVRDYWRLIGVGIFAFVIAVAPIGEFALLHTREFTQRTTTVNVIKEVQDSGSWQPLIGSTRAHALMFNAQGDNNGRHNWTGRPMLDEVTGGLFILGLMLALAYFRRWEYALPVFWIPIIALAGILSISWEAPQSHRAADEVTAVALLAALPLAALWRASDRLPGPVLPVIRQLNRGLRRRAIYAAGLSTVVGLVVVSVVFAAGAHNVDTYFNRQMRDPRTWEEYNTPQTIAARQLNDAPASWKAYVDPVLMGFPSLEFTLNQNPKRELTPFDPAANIPITDEAAVVILTDRAPTVAQRLGDVYPGADRSLLLTPDGNRIGLYTYRLSPSDIAATEGVSARYGPETGGIQRTESKIDFVWPSSAPMAPPFAASFESTLTIASMGKHRIRLEGPTDATLTLDGVDVLTGGSEAELPLAKGAHALRLEAPSAGSVPLRLLWAPPGRTDFDTIPVSMLHTPRIRVTGLAAKLYPGREPAGTPSIEQIDPSVQNRVHLLPLPRPYTTMWTGSVFAPQSGTYRFGTSSLDTSTLWIDGQQVVDNQRPNASVETSLQVTAGWHDIRVRYLDASSFSHMDLFWEPPGGPREVIPSAVLRPWSADLISKAQRGDDDLDRVRASLVVRPATAGRPAAAVSAAGELLSADGALKQPRGVAVGPDGTIYVADAGWKAIVVLSPDGSEPPRRLAEGLFTEPAAVAVLRDRTLVVVDAGAGAILRVDAADGTVIERLIPNVGLYGPRGAGVGVDGRIAIADTGNNRIVIIPQTGSQPEVVTGLREPTDVAFLPDGSLLVAETGAKQITNVKTDGSRIGGWSVPEAFTVVGPHVAVLPRGGWVATVPENKSLMRMAPNERDPKPTTMDGSLRKPVGVAVSNQGLVVADADAATVTRYPLP